MAARKPTRRKPPAAPPGVVAQARTALEPKHRLAGLIGIALGGFVPLASYVVAHYELDPTRHLLAQIGTYFLAGGLLYSAWTVYTWGVLAFYSRIKAVGFVVLLEGVMVAADSRWLALVALGYLMAINGIATGCNLAKPPKPDPLKLYNPQP